MASSLTRFSAAWALGLAVATLPACQPTLDDASDEASMLAANAEPIAFSACALLTYPPSDDRSAECATIDVPLDWDNSAGRRAEFFVKRLRGPSTAAHKQVWLLQGGPGGAGDGFESFAKLLVDRDPTLDVYLPDHRGTGRSTYLDCPETMAKGFDLAACGAEVGRIWGADLKTFSTTTAARDIGTTIARLRAPGQEVHVYGVSYGTYLAQRYLQIFPDQPTAVTLDGICQSGLCSIQKFGYQQDRVGKKLPRDCDADPICGAKLGSDPAEKVKASVAAVSAGSCPALEGIPGEDWRGLLGSLVMSFQARNLIPALVYRSLRCSEQDQVALRVFRDLVFGPPAGSEPTPEPNNGGTAEPKPPPRPNLWSTALQFNVAYSEMEESPIATRDEIQALMADAVFTTYNPSISDGYDGWPRYARDRYVGGYPTSTVPVLLLNGTNDAQTPIEFAEEVARHYTAPNQKLFILPRATHGTVLGASPTAGEPRGQCGRMIWDQFVARPTATLDASCSERILDLGFATSPQAGLFLGTEDLFEGIPTPPPPTRRTSPEARRIVAEIQDNRVRPTWFAH